MLCRDPTFESGISNLRLVLDVEEVDGVPRKINIEVLTTQFGSERLRSDVKTTKPR